MSCHEKEREQEDAYTKTQSPHPLLYIFVCFVMNTLVVMSDLGKL